MFLASRLLEANIGNLVLDNAIKSVILQGFLDRCGELKVPLTTFQASAAKFFAEVRWDEVEMYQFLASKLESRLAGDATFAKKFQAYIFEVVGMFGSTSTQQKPIAATHPSQATVTQPVNSVQMVQPAAESPAAVIPVVQSFPAAGTSVPAAAKPEVRQVAAAAKQEGKQMTILLPSANRETIESWLKLVAQTPERPVNQELMKIIAPCSIPGVGGEVELTVFNTTSGPCLLARHRLSEADKSFMYGAPLRRVPGRISLRASVSLIPFEVDISFGE